MTQDDPTDQADQEPEPFFTLVLEGAGISVDRQVPENLARDIISLVLGGGPTIGSSRSGAGTGRRGSGQQVSIREFLDGANAKRIPQMVTTIGLYLQQGGSPRFSRDDVRSKFAQASEPAPSNLPRDFRTAVANGWIAEDDAGEYYVTDTGAKAVEAKFEGAKNRRTRKRSSSKKAKTTSGNA